MIIAIGGPSNAGKSNLAKYISLKYTDKKIMTLCLDDFVYPENKLPKIHDHIDWEHPNTINFEQFQSRLIKESKKNDLVIAEGFLIFNKEELNILYDKMIFIELQEETFLRRKKEDIRWGREPDWYIAHIWEQYKIFGQAPEKSLILYLQGEMDWPVTRILNFLNI